MEFEEIYRACFKPVYQYVRRLSGNEHIAEEVTSDTFFKALESIDRFRGECRAGGLSAVWWAFPVAELASLICCVIFLRRLYQREIRPLMNASEHASEAAGDGG